MAKLLTIQKIGMSEADYDISSDIFWDAENECYQRNDNDVERTDDQFIIAKDSTLR